MRTGGMPRFLPQTRFEDWNSETKKKLTENTMNGKGKKVMKKNLLKKFALLLALCMSISLVATGCGFENTEVGTTDTAGDTDTTVSDGTVPSDDASYQELYAFIQQPSDNPDKVTIRYATMASEDSLYAQTYTRGYVMLLKWAKEALGDKIEVQFIFNGSIGGTADAVLGNLQMGNIEMTDFTTTSCGEFSSAYMPLDLFYLVKDFDEMGALLDGPAGEMMNEQFTADTNLKNISYGILGPRNMTNSKHPITSVADMQGLKMRVQANQLHMMGMQALGASATNIAFSELFTAMQQGTVDGQENPIDTILQHKYYEVQDYLTITNHLIAVSGLFVNNEWWEALPDDVKTAFEDAAARSEAYAREAWHAENDSVLEELRGLMEVNELDDAALTEFQEAAKTAWPEASAYIGEEYFNQFLEASGLTLE